MSYRFTEQQLAAILSATNIGTFSDYPIYDAASNAAYRCLKLALGEDCLLPIADEVTPEQFDESDLPFSHANLLRTLGSALGWSTQEITAKIQNKGVSYEEEEELADKFLEFWVGSAAPLDFYFSANGDGCYFAPIHLAAQSNSISRLNIVLSSLKIKIDIAVLNSRDIAEQRLIHETLIFAESFTQRQSRADMTSLLQMAQQWQTQIEETAFQLVDKKLSLPLRADEVIDIDRTANAIGSNEAKARYISEVVGHKRILFENIRIVLQCINEMTSEDCLFLFDYLAYIPRDQISSAINSRLLALQEQATITPTRPVDASAAFDRTPEAVPPSPVVATPARSDSPDIRIHGAIVTADMFSGRNVAEVLPGDGGPARPYTPTLDAARAATELGGLDTLPAQPSPDVTARAVRRT